MNSAAWLEHSVTISNICTSQKKKKMMLINSIKKSA